ncbi:disease resistance protein RGA2 isoform X3 [Oryza sativa Japonica Group]|jgi:hypothetical protein|nr:disease resistance protein RGA2 isoform X3 [Oryza sativa Japonica Group]
MAEVVVLAGSGWVVSPIMRKIINDAKTYLGKDMAQELDDLETTVIPQFRFVIKAAERSPRRMELERWLWKLKAAFYDAEDLLDMHEYKLLQRKATGNISMPSTSNSRLALVSTASNLLPANRRLLRKLTELKNILVEAKNFHREFLSAGTTAAAITGPHVNSSSSTITTSLPTSKVFGRDADRDHIISFLCNPDDTNTSGERNYCTSAIVGHGGAGKTTLAQYIYNDERVVNHFDVRMWICISRKLDVHRHTAEIMESATNNNRVVHFTNLNNLQCALRGVLQESQRFLLVLDDVWFYGFQDEEEWAKLLAPLVSQQRGSQVLVTSRSGRLPAPLCCKQVFPLQNMKDTEFLALFKYHAFSGAGMREQHRSEELLDIAGRIAQKLGQSPLAAKVVGSQLSRNMTITAWKDALKSDNLGETRGSLLWSYQNLDPNIQRCFMYCSLFPKGHVFVINELVHLWVAEGFVVDSSDVNSSDQSRTVEDIARAYFREMVSACFFQPVPKSFDTSYSMHDIIHDFAETLSRGDCFRLEDCMVTEIPHTVQHLSVYVDRMGQHKQSICKLIHLRTVIFMEPVMDDANKLFHEVFCNMKKLRVLLLCFYNSRKLPQSIDEFKHLRYLNILKTSISELPGSLCTLYHLQFLRVHRDVNNLPAKICNLSKLRHLERCSPSLSFGPIAQLPVPQIPYIGKLTKLQHVLEFSVAKQIGYELQQLRDMRELRNILQINYLENVRTKDEALEAMLHNKSRLDRLELSWSYIDDLHINDNLHLEVLEGLKPPRELNDLIVTGYRSPVYPSWLLEDSYFVNLKTLVLSNCTSLECLPSSVQLIKHFRHIALRNILNLKTLPCFPGGLVSLNMMGCPLLRFISREELGQDVQHTDLMKVGNLSSTLARILEAKRGSKISKKVRDTLVFEHSSLKQLMALMDDDISAQLQTIKSAIESEREEVLLEENIIKAWLYCQEKRTKLIYSRPTENLLLLPSSIENLSLSSCNLTDGALAVCLQGLTSLKWLSIERIMNLTSFPSPQVLQRLTMLKRLYIRSCWCLRSLGGLREATSLSEVKIDSCISLELVDENGIAVMPSSIGKLSLFGCILGANFLSTDFPRLRSISITCCRSSSSFAIGHLRSLESLSLNNMPDLCFLEGLSCPHLQDIHLINVPNLTAESFSRHHAWKSLAISSSAMLSLMLSIKDFMLPEKLCFEQYDEPSITFQSSANFTSIKFLEFRDSKVMYLPSSLKNLSSLERIKFVRIPNLSSLPDFPNSIQQIEIQDCECLKRSCQAPNGENWQKIECIRWKLIEVSKPDESIAWFIHRYDKVGIAAYPKKLQPGQPVVWHDKNH